MGATLPLLCSGLESVGGIASGESAQAQPERERRLAKLYAANTLGGALGALAAAYLILPALGLSLTLTLSAATSAMLGVVALALGQWWPARSGGPSAAAAATGPDGADDGHTADAVDRADGDVAGGVPGAVKPGEDAPVQLRLDAPLDRESWLLTVLALGSGALVFTSEVIFTHLLALIIGNSVYAFGLILAIFLCCLFLGAALVERAKLRLGDHALPVSLAATSLALVVTLPLWDKLPLLFNNTGEFITSFAAREAMRAFAALFILLVPTTLMGLTFPLLLQRVARYANVGAWVGRLTAINTLGAVIGSLFAGYALLPWLGSERALLVVALCFAGGAAYTMVTLASPVRRIAQLLGATLVVALLRPGWDLARLTAGTNVYFDGAQKADTLLMLREDVHGGVTSVTEADGVRTLYTNGKFQGNNGWEMNAQRYFAHYPSLFVPRFEHALVIGLGTGTTAGTLAAYPWQSIEVAEISPAIAEAARTHFADVNGRVLEDPRVRLLLADGRNHLLLTEQRYDLISIKLSSIWFAGAASLYNAEFYDLVVKRLRPDGILQQWVQLHHITPRDFATVLQTMRAHFEHMAFYYGGGQGVLIASAQPLKASEQRALRFEGDPQLAATLPAYLTQDGRSIRRRLFSLASDALLVNGSLDRFLQHVADGAGEPVDSLVSTDDNLYLEYATPRGNVLPWSSRDDLLAEIRTFRDEAELVSLRGD